MPTDAPHSPLSRIALALSFAAALGFQPAGTAAPIAVDARAPSPAREPADSPATPAAAFEGAVDVQLATVEVIARRWGTAVTDLSAGDLTLEEDGEARPIVALEPIGLAGGATSNATASAGSHGPGASVATPPRMVVLALDLVSLPPWDLRRACRSLLRELPTEPDDTLWVLALLGGDLQLLEPLTHDVRAIRSHLEALAEHAGTRRADTLPVLRVPFLADLDFSRPSSSLLARTAETPAQQRRDFDRLWDDTEARLTSLGDRLALREYEQRLALTARSLIQLAWSHALVPGSKDIVLAYGHGLAAPANLRDEVARRRDPQLDILRRLDATWIDIAREMAGAQFRIHATNLRGLDNPLFDMSNNDLSGVGAAPGPSYGAAPLLAQRTGGQHFGSNGLQLGVRASERVGRYLLTWSSRVRTRGEPRQLRIRAHQPWVRLDYARERTPPEILVAVRRQLATAAIVKAAIGNAALRADLVASASALRARSQLVLDETVPGTLGDELAALALMASYDVNGNLIAIDEQALALHRAAPGAPTWRASDVTVNRRPAVARAALAVVAPLAGQVGITMFDLAAAPGGEHAPRPRSVPPAAR